MEQKCLTIGFIGDGKSTNRYHLPFLLQRPKKFHVKTIYSRHPERHIWAALDGVHYTDRLDDLLYDAEIDLVVVSAPARVHYEYAKAALLAGKHCLVEKPFTHTRAEAEELFFLAETRGLVLQAYQNRRFDSDFLTTKEVLTSGKLGELLEMEMHFDYYRPEVPAAVKTYSPDTSFLYGHACHMLDQVISLFGAPERLHCDVRQLLGAGRMNDYFDLDLYYGTLKVSVKSSYFRVKSRPRFVVYGSRGMWIKETPDRQEEHLKLFYMPHRPDFGLDRPEDYGTLRWFDGDGRYHEEKVASLRGDYGAYYDALYDAIVHGAPPPVRAEDTLLLMSMLEEGTRNLD